MVIQKENTGILEVLLGISGSGKTFAIRKKIKEKIKTHNIYVFQALNDYELLCNEYKGNYISINNLVEVNVFDFNPGSITSGKRYKFLYAAHCKEVATFIKILLQRELKQVEKTSINNVVKDFYRSVGITPKRYSPFLSAISTYLNFGLFLQVLKQSYMELYIELKSCIDIFDEGSNIIKCFAMQKADLSFTNKLNVVNFKEYLLDTKFKRAILYSYITAVKRKIRMDHRPALLVFDDDILFFYGQKLLDTILFDNNDKKLEIILSLSTLTDSNIGSSEFVKRIDSLFLFRQLMSDREILQKWFKLNDELIEQSNRFEMGEAIRIEGGFISKVKFE